MCTHLISFSNIIILISRLVQFIVWGLYPIKQCFSFELLYLVVTLYSSYVFCLKQWAGDISIATSVSFFQLVTFFYCDLFFHQSVRPARLVYQHLALTDIFIAQCLSRLRTVVGLQMFRIVSLRLLTPEGKWVLRMRNPLRDSVPRVLRPGKKLNHSTSKGY